MENCPEPALITVVDPEASPNNCRRLTEYPENSTAENVFGGRPLKLNAYQRKEARQRHDAGETLVDIARTYGVSHMTIARAVDATPNPFAAGAADAQ